uniref:Uncharacterized protein n=1 Tax=Anguilla anguilla TaxID=7936 RepID=A0A0E9RTS8_ANGAN
MRCVHPHTISENPRLNPLVNILYLICIAERIQAVLVRFKDCLISVLKIDFKLQHST